MVVPLWTRHDAGVVGEDIQLGFDSQKLLRGRTNGIERVEPHFNDMDRPRWICSKLAGYFLALRRVSSSDVNVGTSQIP